MGEDGPKTYAEAGVSLATADAVVGRLRAAVRSTGATGFGQFAWLGEAFFGRTFDDAFGLQLFENAFELNAVGTFQAQFFGQLALVRAIGQQFEHARLIQGGRVLVSFVFLQFSYSPAISGILDLP